MIKTIKPISFKKRIQIVCIPKTKRVQKGTAFSAVLFKNDLTD